MNQIKIKKIEKSNRYFATKMQIKT